MNWQIAFDPALPPAVLATAAGLAAVLALATVLLRRRGALLRALALALLLAGLARPSVVAETRRPLDAVVAVVADRSPSQGLGTRSADTDRAAAAMAERLRRLPGIEVREVASSAGTDGDGTRLFADLARSLSDVPPERVGGALLVTDGVVHDVPSSAAALGFSAPVHALITGDSAEFDRRIVLTAAPKFGLVKSKVTLAFRLEDQGRAPPPAAVTVAIRRDGEPLASRTLAPGETASIEVPVDHAGPNIFEIEAPAVVGELSTANNTEVAVVEGIREALKVLLVSGEPHPGERTWRNLLKSDASVDLIHFTILRPADKQDGTPINELSLIAFPTRELFDEKIGQFDLIVFDRYQRRGVLPLIYFDNIARYVEDGGALLMAAGPDPLNDDTVYDSPLAPILPVTPTGAITEEPFRPVETALGRRHPVTRDLPGGSASPPAWSRWFRLVDSVGRGGDSLLAGPADKPLLVLAHEGKGRVAMLLSDEVWLWARGFEGGGPHVELLRNLAHWLMKEPDLEEEALRLTSEGGDLIVERQTLADRPPPVTVAFPDGGTHAVGDFAEAKPGLFRARLADLAPGLYKATDGTHTALAHVGPIDPREWRSLVSTADVLSPIAAATGGSVRRLHPRPGSDLVLPSVTLQDRTVGHAGSDWIGFSRSAAYDVTGVERTDLSVGLIALAAVLAVLGGLWWREGR